MKRSAALQPLSREHHHALEVALALRRATPSTLPGVVRRFAAFWADHGARHFAVEESVLLAVLARDAGSSDVLRRRLVEEHAKLRGLADDLDRTTGRAQLDAAHTLGGMLRDHVRFEERELFPHLERTLSPAALEGVGARLSQDAAAGNY
jgi:hemerythrin-like domain-containing protein